MSSENKTERISVAIPKETHERLSNVARILGMELRKATEEACEAWVAKNAARAQKRASELLKPA